MNRLLILNPGSTSTKIAVYEEDLEVFIKTIVHDEKTLAQFDHIVEQTDYRKQLIEDTLGNAGFQMKDFSAIIARGGILPPIRTGGYLVNEDMLWQLRYAPVLEHASNLGAILADQLGRPWNLPAYIYDGVSADEMEPLYKITGLPEIKRKGQGHNLNLRASAMRYAKEQQKELADCSLIVAHLGGGISIGAFENGRMVDIVNDEDGPMTPERAGALPMLQLMDLFLEDGIDGAALKRRIKRTGGLSAYFGTNDARCVEAMALKGDGTARDVYTAMAVQIAKCIGKEATVLCGRVEAVILTGGVAHSDWLCEEIKKRVGFIAPVLVYAGEDEMRSLALGGLRILNNQEPFHIYKKETLS